TRSQTSVGVSRETSWCASVAPSRSCLPGTLERMAFSLSLWRAGRSYGEFRGTLRGLSPPPPPDMIHAPSFTCPKGRGAARRPRHSRQVNGRRPRSLVAKGEVGGGEVAIRDE